MSKDVVSATPKFRPAAGSFLSLIGRWIHGRAVIFPWIKSSIAILAAPEAILQAARLENQGDLSRQDFTHDLVFPILGEGVFSSSEAEWRRHKLACMRHLKPTRVNLEVWKSAARQAALKALDELKPPGAALGQAFQVDGIQFCRKIVQEVLLEVFLGTAEQIDKARLYHLTHRMDACAEVGTFFLLAFGRKWGWHLARPFQLIGYLARRRLQETIDGWAIRPGFPAEDLQFRENLRSLLFAGQDTLTDALAFSLWMLGARPELQDKIRLEVTERGPDSPALRHAILETLRLLPPVHTLPARTARREIEICGVKIPKGTEVLYSLWFAHRRCERPEEFILERFARHRSERGERFFPFGVGPKRCVGEHLAMTVLCALLATLLTRGRVESSSQTLELGARTVLVPKRPLKLKFRFDPLPSQPPQARVYKG
jgi:cytochrome P450